MISILSVFIGTVPACRIPAASAPQGNDTEETPFSTEPHPVLFAIEAVCMFIFTIEFLFRLVVCPSVKERFRSWYTLTDILYFIPAWSRFIIELSKPSWGHTDVSHATLIIVLDAMVVFRVFRIFRLSRHYRGLRVLLLAIKASFSELFLLFIFVSFSLTIYASCIYSAEHYVAGSNFENRNVFLGLWWSLVTMTTVGYGDFVPSSTIGYIIASMAALTGILIIGMVVPIIAGNFHLYYGFRHAGSEDVELDKPEFVPTLKDNPIPSEMVQDSYRPKSHGPFSKSTMVRSRESHNEAIENLITKKSLSLVHMTNSGTRSQAAVSYAESQISNENGNCGKTHSVARMDSSKVCNSPQLERSKQSILRGSGHRLKSTINPASSSIMEVSEQC